LWEAMKKGVRMNNVLNRLRKYKNADGYVRYLSSPVCRDDVFIKKDLGDFNFKDKDKPIEIVVFGDIDDEKRSFRAVLVNEEYRIDEVTVENTDEEMKCYDADGKAGDKIYKDINCYFSVIKDLKVRMKQIWEKEKDPFEEEFEEYTLAKVVFAGFEGEIK